MSFGRRHLPEFIRSANVNLQLSAMKYQKSPLFFLFLCLLFSLSTASTLKAQPPATEQEEPGLVERFLNIFKVPPAPKDTLATPSLGTRELSKEYPIIYNLIHREQQAYYQSLVDSNYIKWDEINNLSDAQYISPDGKKVVLAKNVKVFGWHPHWMGNAYKNYPFNLLSHVALFSYNINAGNGTPYDNPQVVNGWESEDFDLVALAHEANCKVMLTVTSFGTNENRIFLSDPDRQNRVIEDVVTRMVRIGADGIDIDFELIPQNFEKQFSSFIIRLHQRLALGDQKYQLSVVLPKVNGSPRGNNIYNIKLLQEYVDFFTLTAYDFTTGDFAAGPIAPLYNRDLKRRDFRSIEDVVFNYLEDGLERDKLLLGLPYYGGKWTRYTSPGRADSLSFQHLTYAAIRKANRRNGAPEHVPNVWAARYLQQSPSEVEGFTSKEEVTWYDDSLTLNTKYDWVLEQRLGGVGIWALGYDMPGTELWGLIDEKFAPVNDTLVYYEPSRAAWNLPVKLIKYSDAIGISGLFIFTFLAIGFIVALFDWRVRDVFFREKTLRLLYIVASFALVSATLAVVLFLRTDLIDAFGAGTLAMITLSIGLVLGALLVRLISRWFAAGRKMTP